METPEYEMTREELLGIVRQRIWRAHQMTLEEYVKSRQTGSLERTAADAELDGYFDDFGTAFPPAQSEKPQRSKGPAHIFHAPRRWVRKQWRRAAAGT